MLPCFGYNDLHIYTNNTTFKFNVIINFYIFILVLLAFLNITGYIVSRIENSETCCENCIASVCAFEPIVAEYTALVRLKEFKIGCLKYVTDKCFKFFLRMEETFRKHRSLIIKIKETYSWKNCLQNCIILIFLIAIK